jgi:hypothetical protein
MICPGKAPVSSPFSNSTVPLTITLSMPTAARFTRTPPAGKVATGSRGLVPVRVGVEDRDVGGLARGNKAEVGEIVHQSGLAGQPPPIAGADDGVLRGEDDASAPSERCCGRSR